MHNTHLLDCGCCRRGAVTDIYPFRIPRCYWSFAGCGLNGMSVAAACAGDQRRAVPPAFWKNIAAWPASLIRYLESKPRTFDASWRLSPSTLKTKNKKTRRYHHLNVFPTSAHRLPSSSHWVFFNLGPFGGRKNNSHLLNWTSRESCCISVRLSFAHSLVRDEQSKLGFCFLLVSGVSWCEVKLSVHLTLAAGSSQHANVVT